MLQLVTRTAVVNLEFQETSTQFGTINSKIRFFFQDKTAKNNANLVSSGYFTSSGLKPIETHHSTVSFLL